MPAIHRFALVIATLTVFALTGDRVTGIVAGTAETASPLPVRETSSPPNQNIIAPDESLHAVRGAVSAPKKKRAVASAPKQSLLSVVDQPDILPRHRVIADALLRMMPSHCLGTLRQFYVRYDAPETRGLAGKSTLIVSGNVSDDEFRALLLHELTHVVDLGCLQGSPSSGKSGFRDGDDVFGNDDPSVAFYSISWLHERILKQDTRAEDFVSGYARWDAFEDMAETVTAYVLHREGLMVLARRNPVIAKKVAWVEYYLFPQLPTVAQSAYTWSTTPPWDTTKLPYTWNGVESRRNKLAQFAE